MNLKNKVVVITGGTSGIGFSIIQKLLTTDVKVIALFELDNPNSTETFSKLQEQCGARIDFYSCDVTDTPRLEGCFDKVLEKYKAIDVLINNAGIFREDNPERTIDINYKAVALGSLMMIERIGKHKAGDGGLIINISSLCGLSNYVLPIYCSTKHAVVSFTRTMKAQFDKTGVRVMALCPGLTETPILEDHKGLNFIDYNGMLDGFFRQSPESVATAIMQIIQVGQSGDVWVVEDDQAAYRVKDGEHYKNLRIDQ